MNIRNNENNPFEDVFRDRLADFESEPDAQLWQKIEPHLPVNFTRKFPYWQTSAVVIILLLAGLWTYHEKYSDNVITKSNESQANNLNPLLSVSPYTIKNSLKPLLPVSSQTAQKTNIQELFVKTQTITNPLTYLSSVRTTGTNRQTTAGNNRIGKSSIFSNHNTTIKTSITYFDKTEENKFLNNDGLNLISVNNSNEKQEITTENPSNESNVSRVFSDKESVSILSKKNLIFLDSKPYSLVNNHFKTLGIKFAVAPKKDEYFKERKPWEIYASVMPLLNYYTITPNGNDANFVHSIAVNNDQDRLGFYSQAGLVFTLSDRFKLRTGLTFTRTNHSISYQIRTDSLIIQPSDKQGVDVSFAELNKNYSQVANYLGTKIEVQYIILKGEALSHYLNVGLEGAYRLNSVKEFNGFANFAYGVTRQIGDNAYLFVEPTFSYSLNQQSDYTTFLLIKPNKIGFNFGVNFKIK